MRKESIGRLLLSLFTAFIMVAGVFGAAVITQSLDWAPSQPSENMAASEPEGELGGVGEAPTSAIIGNSELNTAEPQVDDPLAVTFEEMQQLKESEATEETSSEPTLVSYLEERGTRYPPGASVDANGPYGTPTDPLYEGWSTTLSATITGDDPANSWIAWDLEDDGYYEIELGDYPQGQMDIPYTFTDNFAGQARVRAWDGTYTPVTSKDSYWQETTSEPQVGLYVYRAYYVWGWRFSVTQPITVTDLGGQRAQISWYYDAIWPQYRYETINLWSQSRVRLRQVTSVTPAVDSWAYKPITPITLVPGQNYWMSAYVYSTGWPNYYLPTDYNPGFSPDGIINAYGTYYRYGYPGDVFPSYSYSTSYIPRFDFKYEKTVMMPNYLEDTADIFVQNVAPTVSITPSAAYGEEGTPFSFIGEFADPGIGDDWWFKYEWGDGEETDWIKFDKGIPPIPLSKASVLVYYDGPGGWNMGGTALSNLGLSYTLTTSVGSFQSQLNTGNYNLAIFQCSYYGFSASVYDDILTFCEDGNRLILSSWNIEFNSGHGLFDYMKASFKSSYTTPIDIYRWELGHDLLNVPNTVPDLRWTTDMWYRDGQRLGVLDGGTAVMGYTVDPDPDNQAALIGRNDHAAILNGFTPNYYRYDDDGDGKRDMVELMENEILWVLEGSGVINPWPDPALLPEVYHVYKDDHPEHITPEDDITATLYVKDDDYVEGGWQPVAQLAEDFSGGSGTSPPPGWSVTPGGGWRFFSSYRTGSGTTAQAWYYYRSYQWSYLYSPTVDLSALSNSMLEFDHYWWANYGSPGWYPQDGYLEISAGGGPWIILDEWHGHNPPEEEEHKSYDISAIADGNVIQIRFRIYHTYNWLWEVDNVEILADMYITPVPGLGSDSTPLTIRNVKPTAFAPDGFDDIVDEMITIDFNEFTFTDPALYVETEEFFWRWNFDDGTVTSWMQPAKTVPTEFRILAVHSLQVSGHSGSYADPVWPVIAASSPLITVIDKYNLIDTLVAPDRSLMDQYNVILWIGNYGYTGGYPPWVSARTDFGDNLADWLDDNMGTFVSHMVTFGDSPYFGDIFRLMGRFIDDDYGAFDTPAPYTFATVSLGTVHEPGHKIMDGVTALSSTTICSGNYDITVGGGGAAAGMDGLRIASWSNGDAAVGCKELNNGAKTSHLGYWFADGSFGGDVAQALGNAMFWGLTKFQPIIDPISHDFGDNGLYNVDLQMIDDDCDFDFASGYPVYVGEDEYASIGHNFFPVEVYNVDPVISTAVRAYISLDLSIRMSGTKDCSATMTLYENGMAVGSTTVLRDPGSPDVGSFPATLMVSPGYDYEVIVECFDGSGGNPSWIFNMHFPDGKIKGLKYTFNDEHGWTWTITDEELMQALIGQEIVFEGDALDYGSDDLAFVWQWGDTTPHGVHVYSNADLGSDMVEGASGDAEHIFDVLDTDANPANDRELWFDRPANDIRTPQMRPIRITDTITHTFNEAYYYYVCLIVFDDDCGDGYPSPYIHGGGYDMEYAVIDLS
jgi:hypothetical protein